MDAPGTTANGIRAQPARVPAALEIRGLSKAFTATRALDRVDFEVRPGEIHALLGENGAGKSTLIKILAGVHRADAGEVAFHGRPAEFGGPLPIAYIHQDLGLVESMTVAENFALVTGYPRRGPLVSWARLRTLAREALAGLGCDVEVTARVSSLTASEKSLLAIARALAIEAELLILDEPTATLPRAEVERLFDALRLLRERGVGIVYVTHRLDEVFALADRVTVLRNGRRVVTTPVADVDHAGLVAHIVGRSLEQLFAEPALVEAEVVVELDGVCSGAAGPVSLRLARGEILALVGLRGAGHEETGRAIFGDAPLDAGRILAGGAELTGGIAGAVRQGFGFVSSKRGEESLAPAMAVRENLFLNPAMSGSPAWAPRSVSGERGRADEVLERFAVRPAHAGDAPISTLSGGNQQKVVLARWLHRGGRVLVLEQPTMGVDVGAKAEIYKLIRGAAEAGLAVLLVSSDFEEVAGMSHRALVFQAGRIVAEVQRPELSTDRLTVLALGEGGAPVQAAGHGENA